MFKKFIWNSKQQLMQGKTLWFQIDDTVHFWNVYHGFWMEVMDPKGRCIPSDQSVKKKVSSRVYEALLWQQRCCIFSSVFSEAPPAWILGVRVDWGKKGWLARVFATVYWLTAAWNNNRSREASGSTKELGQSTDVTYVEINSPGLLVPWIHLPDTFYLLQIWVPIQ